MLGAWKAYSVLNPEAKKHKLERKIAIEVYDQDKIYYYILLENLEHFWLVD